MRRSITVGAVAALVLVALLVAPTGATALSGANDYGCRPSAAHPRPVVLVHGTFLNQSEFEVMAPQLAAAGYCVFAFDYGCESADHVVCATGRIEDSAAELASVVAQVLAATGAAQVDVVGHSQGGMMPRYYMKFLGGAPRVHELVGLAPSNHGSGVDGLSWLGNVIPGSNTLCAACVEMIPGSQFMTNLNAGGETLPGVGYTVIVTRYDEVVTPYDSAFIDAPGVANILLQTACPLDHSGHLDLPADPNAIGWVRRALDPTLPAPACVPFAPPG